MQCVVPENIHTPPWKGLEILGGGGAQRPRNFRRWGGGLSQCILIFQTGLNFHTVVSKVLLFAFCFSSCECKKINLANLKCKMKIFVLVRLDILLLLESHHFPK